MNVADALAKINNYLRDTHADEETFRAFNVVRNNITELIGKIMMMGVRTGPAFDEEED